jgi:hypothetical protein
VAGGAHDGGVHLQLTGGAEDGLGELDVEADQGVLAAPKKVSKMSWKPPNPAAPAPPPPRADSPPMSYSWRFSGFERTS